MRVPIHDIASECGEQLTKETGKDSKSQGLKVTGILIED